MSRHRFEIIVEIDDEALAEHDGDRKPPPNSIEDWTIFGDLARAISEAIVDEGESEIEYQGPVEADES